MKHQINICQLDPKDLVFENTIEVQQGHDIGKRSGCGRRRSRSKRRGKMIDDEWSGMLTIKNCKEVTERLMRMLSGRVFTTITINESYGLRPDICQGQVLKDPIAPYHDKNVVVAGFSIHDNHGLWCIHTSLEKDQYDPEFNNPYFEFKKDWLTVRHRAGAGNLLCWTFILEKGFRGYKRSDMGQGYWFQ